MHGVFPFCALLAAIPSPHADTLEAGRRAPLMAHVDAPDGKTRAAAQSALEAALATNTAFELATAAELGADPARCVEEQTLTCWTELAAGRAEVVLVLSVAVLSASEWSVSALLVDVNRATDLSARGSNSAEAIEDLLFEEAAFAESETIAPGDLDATARKLIRGARARFTGIKTFLPTGRLTLELPRPDQEVFIDGRSIGRGSGSVVVEGISAGSHALSISDPAGDLDYATHDVWIDPKTESEVEIRYEVTSPAPAARQVVLFTGLASMGLGLGTLIYAASASPTTYVCPSGSCAPEAEQNTTRSFAAPTGTALLASGATWSLGSQFGDEWQFPWIAIGLGLAAGGAAFAITHAADGGFE